MPFAFFLGAIVLIVAAIRGKHKELFDLLKDDFTGERNFIYFVLAIGFLTALGSIDRIKPVTNAFLVLIIIAIILANGKNNLFANLINEVKKGTS